MYEFLTENMFATSMNLQTTTNDVKKDEITIPINESQEIPQSNESSSSTTLTVANNEEIHIQYEDVAIGQMVQAICGKNRAMKSVATVENKRIIPARVINEEMIPEKHELYLNWIESAFPAWMPISDCFVMDNKRKRVNRRNFDEDAELLRIALNEKKKKLKAEMKARKPNNAILVDGEYIKPAKLIDEVTKDINSQLLEECVAERALSVYLDSLRLFLSKPIVEKLKSFTNEHKDNMNINEIYRVEMENLELLEQPLGLRNVKMRNYQLKGISWLVDRYNKGINCILADEMGLGKTLQSIAFIAYLRENKALVGPNLVVAPLSVLFNWIAECKKFYPALRILRVHGNNSKDAAELKFKMNHTDDYDICLTTYEMIKSDHLSLTFQRIHFRTVILDEGHRIKNLETDTSKACLLLKSRFKLVLTGTPVQNNLSETYSLLHYLMPRIFDNPDAFKNSFGFQGSDIVIDRQMLDKAHYMLRPFVLRRIKTEVEEKLPPKLETLIKCPLSEMQKFWIKRLLLKDANLLESIENNDDSTPGASDRWKKLQSLLTQLRKAANHPFLFPNSESLVDGELITTEEIVSASGKMMLLDRLLNKLLAKGHRIVIFSQYTRTLDILSDYFEFRRLKHYRLDGSTNRVMRELLINHFNQHTTKNDTSIFCLSTRAGGEGVNLFTADTVILFDSDWNPQVDIQAMSRVHRIGQTKVVHIYRLVSAGSVEERIVQRAQKKLFLDAMVNRGSSAQAIALDMKYMSNHASDGNLSATAEDDDKVDSTTMMSALKFGWNACFSGDYEKSLDISDKDINAIIDRTRGLDASGALVANTSTEYDATTSNSVSESSSTKSKKSKSDSPIKSEKLQNNTEMSLETFEENVPMVNIRIFEGDEIKKVTSIADISREWVERSQRDRKARVVTQYVTGVGKINVLKMNQYTLKDGEPSIYERESNQQAREAAAVNKKVRKQIVHQAFCQSCLIPEGLLMLCNYCPAAYHPKCAGYKVVPTSIWSCPHHQCADCSKRSTFLFRCEVCPKALCEDCIIATDYMSHKITWSCQRYTDTGYKNPGNTCYMICSADCTNYNKVISSFLKNEKEAVKKAKKEQH